MHGLGEATLQHLSQSWFKPLGSTMLCFAAAKRGAVPG